MPNAFLDAKAIARMIANEDPHSERDNNDSMMFLKIFLSERYTNSTTMQRS